MSQGENKPKPDTPNIFRWLCFLCAMLTSGCAAWTNPVANGVPVRLLPEELLAEPKADLAPIPLTWLRTKPNDEYTLDTGDVLGVYIEGVLGETDQLPPIHFPDVGNLPPSVGFPIPIREDGTVPLPLVDPIDVAGLTISGAQAKILAAYTDRESEKEIIKPGETRVLVTLVAPRTVKIRVVREDSTSVAARRNFNPFGFATPISERGSGQGMIVQLPETEADLLSVLAETGGLPGPNATNEVVIQRGYQNENAIATLQAGAVANDCEPGEYGQCAWPGFVRIPLRWPRCKPAPFKPEDIRLHDGDIVFIPARDVQAYYTGGLLPSREVTLPRDYDLGVVEALLRVGGPLINGAVNANNLSGAFLSNGLGNPSPSLLTVLRKSSDGRQVAIRVDLNKAVRDSRENILVQAGDVLLLQETPQEAFARYISNAFNFTFIGQVINRGSAAGTASVTVP